MSAARIGYILGVVLILAGVTVDLLTGGDGGWRLLRSALIGAGAGICAVTFMQRRRRTQSSEQGSADPQNGIGRWVR